MINEIITQPSGDNLMYLPLHDIDEHKNYFCWTLEDALMTRIYYKKHGDLPTGDLIYAAILDYLGIDNSSPYDTETRTPCFSLSLTFP